MRNTQQEIATPDNDIVGSQQLRKKRIGSSPTKYLTYIAVFAALAIVMKLIGQVLTFTDSFKVTLIYFIWLIAGAVLGPIGGGAVGFVSDVLGAIVIPMGAINPLLVLGNTAYGVIAGLCFKYTPSRSYVVKMLVTGVVCTVICTCLFNSFAIWVMFYKDMFSFWQYFAAKRAMQPLVAGINIFIAVAMIPLLVNIGLLPKQIKKEKKDAQHIGKDARR